ncbi:hypothetical protein N7448_009191 [Penicillium atrosanguineum]|uniref:Uncharacterized protein n=1 Tax=Penicillium atrosanguineum TaxID=1132637 RepID=A0A9W9U6K2_9EURO|nr:uncharacterized protein N7443_006439 [Penicillium atrosanguineum]KAJ5123094.1 hypothetical protein N7448_009191 [Penicillium atrosanguineum]KAJ5298319.1 hypothetical protein N7443_006439 [Penicillium atrosanguineum]KAJ5321413.1 hypothetical protein N7476_004415 [Penicillium atrosanguineum]
MSIDAEHNGLAPIFQYDGRPVAGFIPKGPIWLLVPPWNNSNGKCIIPNPKEDGTLVIGNTKRGYIMPTLWIIGSHVGTWMEIID